MGLLQHKIIIITAVIVVITMLQRRDTRLIRGWRSAGIFVIRKMVILKNKDQQLFLFFFSCEASSSVVIDSSHVFPPRGLERCWVSLPVIVKLVYSRGATNPSDPVALHNYKECNYKTDKHCDTLSVPLLTQLQEEKLEEKTPKFWPLKPTHSHFFLLQLPYNTNLKLFFHAAYEQWQEISLKGSEKWIKTSHKMQNCLPNMCSLETNLDSIVVFVFISQQKEKIYFCGALSLLTS